MAHCVEECLANRDGWKLRYLLSNEPPDHCITPHLLVDDAVGTGYEIRQRPDELLPISKLSSASEPALKSKDVNSKPAVSSLRLLPKQKQGRESYFPVGGEKSQVTESMGDIPPCATKPDREEVAYKLRLQVIHRQTGRDLILDWFGSALPDEPRQFIPDQRPIRPARPDYQSPIACLDPSPLDCLDR